MRFKVLSLGVFIAALSTPAAADGALEAPEAKPLPGIRASCPCRDEIPADVLIVEGLVVDAEASLDPDRRAPNDRQATIFDIFRASRGDHSDRTKIWHSTNTNKCGVVFDYGRRYVVAARENEDGALETDKCLMRAAKAADNG
jgi:hypothetical protein